MPIWNLEWLNLNSGRAFPFKEDATRIDATGAITLPNTVVVDFVMVVPDTESTLFYLRQLMYSGNLLTLVIGSDTGTLVSLSLDVAAHTANTAYTVRGQGSAYGIIGRIVIGDLTELSALVPPGNYNFDSAATAFEARTVRPDIRALNSLIVVDADNNESDPITGPVRLVAGANIRLTVVEGDVTSIRIDAVNNPDYDEACDCEDGVVVLPPILTINGVPSTNGDFDISGGSACIQVTTENGKIVITDTCSKPCCGCPEQEFNTQRLALADATIARLEAILAQLGSRQLEFYNAVIAGLG